MKVEEVKGVCKDRSKWKKVTSTYPNWKRVLCFVYMCVYTQRHTVI
jgi:hypothetical protein